MYGWSYTIWGSIGCEARYDWEPRRLRAVYTDKHGPLQQASGSPVPLNRSGIHQQSSLLCCSSSPCPIHVGLLHRFTQTHIGTHRSLGHVPLVSWSILFSWVCTRTMQGWIAFYLVGSSLTFFCHARYFVGCFFRSISLNAMLPIWMNKNSKLLYLPGSNSSLP